MTTMLAQGQPLGPTGSFIGAAVLLLVCLYLIVSVFKPSIRCQWGEGGDTGGPMSAVGCAACAISAAAWSFCLFCNGISYQPVERYRMPILLTAFVVVLLAALGDFAYYRRGNTPRMKPFHVYLKDPTDPNVEQTSKKP